MIATDQFILQSHKPQVIAFHCSGSNPGQWNALTTALGADTEVVAPPQFGSAGRGEWPGHRPFRLADDAAIALNLMDHADGTAHLVGHSYGGGLALHVAALRPSAVRSLTLYEPSLFNLLAAAGSDAVAECAEVEALVDAIQASAVVGDHEGAMATFVDYWAGAGSWTTLRPGVQEALRRWCPKALLDFHALFQEPVIDPVAHLITCPVEILVGEFAPVPARRAADLLAERLQQAEIVTVPGAGHMGPLTHPVEVAGLMARHIRLATPTAALNRIAC